MATDQAAQPVANVDEEAYDSAEDEDFQLDDAQDESELSSDDETEPAKKKRKTDKKADAPEEVELDSGDEVTIKKAQDKRKKRKGKKGKGGDDAYDLDDDDEGGTGGFVRTRAMKTKVQEERRPLAKIDGATVDVNALWEQMNNPESQLGSSTSHAERQNGTAPESDRTVDADKQEKATAKPEDKSGQYADQMIKIKRTYEFAGEMITEEKVVPRDSAEAKVFLASGEAVEYADADAAAAAADAARNVRRPLRKISRFDPNPTGTIKKSWEKQPLAAGDDAKGPKINTVEKSRLDWAQYVDQAGIKDELRTHSKAKEGYMGRMDFLGRMDARREEDARQARLKGM